MKKFKVKAINRYSSKAIDNNCNSYVPDGYPYCNLEDCAVFYTHAYRDTFGKTLGSETKERKLHTFLKISFNGKCIHRKYLTDTDIKGINQDNIGLTPSSIRLLASDRNDDVVGKEVNVCKGCWFMYYWDHPFHATRVAFRVGLISLGVSLISLLLTVLFRFV